MFIMGEHNIFVRVYFVQTPCCIEVPIKYADETDLECFPILYRTWIVEWK